MNFYYQISHTFRKIEFPVFLFLCLILIITSKVNKKFTDDVGMFFIDISIPVVKAGSLPFNKIIDAVTEFKELVNAKSENAALRDENEKLKSLYIKSLNINQENKELKDLVKFVGVKSAKYNVARLISYSNQIFSHSAFIDAGSELGIKEDSVVTGKNSMIGRISDVSDDKSRILLLTDITSRIPIITSGSRTRGILAGNNTDLMEILYLDNNHHIAVGDMVFTSGDGDSLPPGLLVGVVKKVNQNYVAVTMVEDVNNLNLVAIAQY